VKREGPRAGSREPEDRVEEMATLIARLTSAEKQRLWTLLAAQGELPGPTGSRLPEQKDLLPSRPQSPRPPDYVLTFDGGSRGNPGRGYGSYAMIRVQDGRQCLERLEFGDGYTNNEAEYDTLIAGLQDLIQRIEKAGRRPEEFALEVRGDSMLVISQLQGRWKARELRLRERRDRCLRLFQRFGSVELKTQPREESVRILGH